MRRHGGSGPRRAPKCERESTVGFRHGRKPARAPQGGGRHGAPPGRRRSAGCGRWRCSACRSRGRAPRRRRGSCGGEGREGAPAGHGGSQEVEKFRARSAYLFEIAEPISSSTLEQSFSGFNLTRSSLEPRCCGSTCSRMQKRYHPVFFAPARHDFQSSTAVAAAAGCRPWANGRPRDCASSEAQLGWSRSSRQPAGS